MKSLYTIALALCAALPTNVSPNSKDEKYALINGISSVAMMGALTLGATKNLITIDQKSLYLALSYCGFFGLKQVYNYVNASETTIGEKSTTFNSYRYIKAGLFGALSAGLWMRVPSSQGIAPLISLLALNEVFQNTDDIEGDNGYNVNVFNITSPTPALTMGFGACLAAAGWYFSSRLAPEKAGAAIGIGAYTLIDGALEIERKNSDFHKE